ERGDRDGAPRWRYQWFVSGVDRVDPAPMGWAEADARVAAAIAEYGREGQSSAMLIESVLVACNRQVNGVPPAQIVRDVAPRLDLDEGAADALVDAGFEIYCPDADE